MPELTQNYVAFLRGTPTAYNNLAEKDSDTLYFVSEPGESTGKLYLGEILISGSISEGEVTAVYLSDLKDVGTAGAKQNSLLGFDTETEKWIPMDIETLVPNLVDAEAGTGSLVPAPAAEEKNNFLRGDGTWAPIEVTSEHQTNVFEVQLQNNETHETAIARAVGDTVLNDGDIAIVKALIHGNKLQYTAYVFKSGNWVAMDGNYNAKNVYFDSDFTFTKEIGTVSIPESGNVVVDAEGKNLYEFFAGLFAKEEYPSIPEVSVVLSGGTNVKKVEVGTKVSATYSFTTTVPAYAYGPDTGVTFSEYKATLNGETKEGKSGTFTEVQVTDDTNLVITGSVEQSAGAIPLTNLGNEYAAAQIPAKSWTGLTASTALSGYRAWFCGYKNGDNAIDDPEAITGAEIRALGNSANGSWLSSMKVTQMKQMFFAAPAGKGYKPVVKDATTTMPQTVLGPITVYVKGANDYVTADAPNGIAYDVWYVNNTSAASGSTTLNITKS